MTPRLLPSGPRAWLVELAAADVVGFAGAVRRRDDPDGRRRRAGGAHGARGGRRPRVARSGRGVAAHRSRPSDVQEPGATEEVEIGVQLRRRRPRRRRRSMRHVAPRRSSSVTPHRRTGAPSAGSPPASPTSTGLDPALHLPRRPTPRTRVPSGSVAIAAEYTAVYPSESPGGWHLIGHTDAAMWDADPRPAGARAPGHARQVRRDSEPARRRGRRLGDDDPGRRPPGARRHRCVHQRGARRRAARRAQPARRQPRGRGRPGDARRPACPAHIGGRRGDERRDGGGRRAGGGDGGGRAGARHALGLPRRARRDRRRAGARVTQPGLAIRTRAAADHVGHVPPDRARPRHPARRRPGTATTTTRRRRRLARPACRLVRRRRPGPARRGGVDRVARRQPRRCTTRRDADRRGRAPRSCRARVWSPAPCRSPPTAGRS